MNESKRPLFQKTAERYASQEGHRLMLPVIEKELLHYEILQAMDEARLLDRLTFQGGTCLRLCYGAERYSEDLDFAGGADFDAYSLAELKDVLEEVVGKRYGLHVSVKNPKALNDASRALGVSVDVWKLVVVTAPDRPDIPHQRISLEVASVPAHTKQIRNMEVRYAGLPSSYGDVLVPCEMLEEICADKLKAFVCAENIRYRDLWDLRWIAAYPGFKKGMIPEILALKLKDYSATKLYADKLTGVLDSIDVIIASDAFMTQMKRFLPMSVVERTIARPEYRDHVVATIRELYEIANS